MPIEVVVEMKTDLLTVTPEDRPDYRQLVAPVAGAVWPEFMLQDPVSGKYWGWLYEKFPAFQFALFDPQEETPAAVANSVPLRWERDLEELPDEGWDWALTRSVKNHIQGAQPNLLCGLQIAILPAYQGRGLSKVLLRRMIELAFRQGLERVIIPVRPSWKDRYPLTPLENYRTWTTGEGLPYDPWLRVHARAGGRMIKTCPRAMRIPGTIQEWEHWTGLRFFESGEYIVPGALRPVAIHLEQDLGLYIEPNVWVVHQAGKS